MYLDTIIEGYSKRLIAYASIIILIFLTLIIFLWKTQLQGGEANRQKISRQSYRKMRLSPVRGRILTEDGKIVADTLPSFDAVFHISEMRQPGKRSKTVRYVTKKITETAAILGLKPDAINLKNLREILKNSLKYDRTMFNNFWLKRKIERQKMFPEMTREDVWNQLADDRAFASEFTDQQLKEIPVYRRFFSQLERSRQLSDRISRHIITSGQLNEFTESWLNIATLRKKQLNDRREKIEAGALSEDDKKIIQQAQKVLSLPADDFSKNGTWRKLHCSWRWLKYEIFPKLSQEELIEIIGQSYEELIEITVSNHISRTAAIPYKAFKNLDIKNLGAISEAMYTIPGLEIQLNCRRQYPDPLFAPHLLGTTGFIKPTDYQEEKFFYSLPELKGKFGLEYTYDKALRGVPGKTVVQVDTSGYSHEVKDTVFPKQGSELVLNINSKAQTAAQKALENLYKREERFGAIVVLDIHTGAVKAMASYPTFNLSNYDYELLNENEDKPLLNRALAERYTPGSIVKPLVGLAALQTGAIQPDFTNFCDGFHYVDRERLKGRTRCAVWRSGGHGEVDLFSAIEQSCNPFFNEIGIRTTFDKLRPFFVQAGFGSKTGIDLNSSPIVRSEISGYLPTRESKRRQIGFPWNAWDTAQFSMGQADQGVTPLQITCYTAAIANGGTLYKPKLVKLIKRPKGQIITTFKPEVKSKLDAEPLYYDLIRQGMHQVVWGDHAGAPIARQSPIPLAGKTGTAQVGRGKHTWFTCFGPEKSPKYACTVLVINGRSGGKSAAPVVTEFFQKWLSGPEK